VNLPAGAGPKRKLDWWQPAGELVVETYCSPEKESWKSVNYGENIIELQSLL